MEIQRWNIELTFKTKVSKFIIGIFVKTMKCMHKSSTIERQKRTVAVAGRVYVVV